MPISSCFASPTTADRCAVKAFLLGSWTSGPPAQHRRGDGPVHRRPAARSAQPGGPYRRQRRFLRAHEAAPLEPHRHQPGPHGPGVRNPHLPDLQPAGQRSGEVRQLRVSLLRCCGLALHGPGRSGLGRSAGHPRQAASPHPRPAGIPTSRRPPPSSRRDRPVWRPCGSRSGVAAYRPSRSRQRGR